MSHQSDLETLRRKSHQYLWMHNRDWLQMAEEGEPMIAVQGDGVRITDFEGNRWIDVNGGYNSVNVGYGRHEIAEAAFEQMSRLPYFPNGTTTEPTALLSKKLAEMTPGSLSRVFPVSGGSEANETAIKIARAYHRRRGEPQRYKIISRQGSYHGTTTGVLWLGGSPLAPRHDFEPAYPGMVYAPQPLPQWDGESVETPSECAVRCARAVEELINQEGPTTVAAMIAEPVAVPMGAVVPGDEYWPMLREICDRYGVLLIADEVINGFGRTGKMFAVEHWDVVPDIMTVAKGIISSYLPLAAAIATEEVAGIFAGEDDYLRHIMTSSGHPVSAAASLKNIEIIETEGMVENAAEVGAYFKEQLEAMMGDHPSILDVRGVGLLLAVELARNRVTREPFAPGDRVVDRLNENFRRQGLILRVGGPVINMGPPLCTTTADVDEIVHALDLSLWRLEGDLGIAQYA